MEPTPSIFKSTRKKRLFLRKKLPLRIYSPRSTMGALTSKPAPKIETPAVPQTMTPARLMFGMELDEYEAKFYGKRFETIDWNVDIAEPEAKEVEVLKKDPKKKSFVQRIKGDINKYTIGMMGLEMEMRLRVEDKRVSVN